MTDAPAALAVAHLSASYDGVIAVSDVSITVSAGRIASVIGPNGAGKTTLLNSIMGILPSRGHILMGATPIGALPIEARVAAGVSLVPEQRELFSTMTVIDNLRLGFFRHRTEGRAAGRAALDEVFALFPRLAERRAQAAGTLSGGERQMLAMGRALMARPRVLMLDEPSLGLAPLIVRDIFRTIVALRAKGVAILLVEQNARAALQVADHGYVLEMGRITHDAPAAELAADERIVDMYLGPARATAPAARTPAP